MGLTSLAVTFRLARAQDALRRTMRHLVTLMNSNRLSFEKVHRFLWDR